MKSIMLDMFYTFLNGNLIDSEKEENNNLFRDLKLFRNVKFLLRKTIKSIMLLNLISQVFKVRQKGKNFYGQLESIMFEGS